MSTMPVGRVRRAALANAPRLIDDKRGARDSG